VNAIHIAPARAEQALAQLSTGHCYEPTCDEPIIRVVDGKRMLHVHIAHIQSIDEGDRRYDPAMTEREQHNFGNIALLCPRHLAGAADLPADVLWRWKARAEGGLAVQLGDLDGMTQEKLEKLMTGAVLEARPSAAPPPELPVLPEHVGMLLEAAQSLKKVAEKIDASATLSELHDTVQSMERASENLAYAALTVPASPSTWSWRSFGWGMVAAMLIVLGVLALRTLV
jgi:hypothetical protein